jgi:selenocysteine lyase/cysteine desulfurase
MRALSDEIERSPDRFMRRTWLPMLTKVREQVAGLLGATTEEVVMVPNTTHGVNNILSNIEWQDGDIIVLCESSSLESDLVHESYQWLM